MKCDSCEIERKEEDFINKNKICYRCVYRKKTEIVKEIKTKQILLCRKCGKEIVQKLNAKKRQRSVFCSDVCAINGHKEQLKNHWTRKARLRAED